MNLTESQDRADGRKESEKEQTYHASLLRRFDFQSEQEGDRKKDHGHVANDGVDGEAVERGANWKAMPMHSDIPRGSDLCKMGSKIST